MKKIATKFVDLLEIKNFGFQYFCRILRYIFWRENGIFDFQKMFLIDKTRAIGFIYWLTKSPFLFRPLKGVLNFNSIR